MLLLRVQPVAKPQETRNPAGRDVWCSEQQKKFEVYMRGAMEA